MNYNFWKNKKILITGHTGFKGSWMALFLSHLNAKVYGYSLEAKKESNYYKSNIKSILTDEFIGDINNLKDLDSFLNIVKPDIVFHLAAQPIVLESFKFPIETFQTNVIGTLNVLKSAQSANVKNICVITSDKCYLNKEWDLSYRENDILGGKDPYSASKAACEIAVASWRQSFSNDDNIYTARAGNVIGGGDVCDFRLFPDLCKSILSRTQLTIRNPNSIRPWQHVLDALYGYITLAEYMHNNSLNTHFSFNFGPLPRDFISVKEAVSIAEGYVKNKINVIYGPPAENKEANILMLDSTLATTKLKWQPRWSVHTAIEKTIYWTEESEINNDMQQFSLSQIKDFLNEQH